ncbi:MAG: hypothetical protein GF355_09785 [Candidatus Eisenbacteria bacterium]|nr:hypothetical protein [Candidatus Eisenbacteria bacterium]
MKDNDTRRFAAGPESTGPEAPDTDRLRDELTRLAVYLEDTAASLRRLQSLLPQFLPKKAAPRADLQESEPDSASEQPEYRGATPQAAENDVSGLEAMVERGFQALFGESPSGEVSDETSAETADEEAPPAPPAGRTPRAPSGGELRLRLRRGDEIWEIPWSWVRDVQPGAADRSGRLTLEDAGAEAEIIVDQFLDVVPETMQEESRQNVRQPRTVAELLPLAQGGPHPASAADVAPGDEGGGAPAETTPRSAPSPPPGTVWIVSPSSIVRSFLRRHLEARGLVVEEAEAPPELWPPDVLGVFMDRDLADSESGTSCGLPVVHLSHQVERSRLDPGAPAAMLAKPFAKNDVADALRWMEERRAGGALTGDEEADAEQSPGRRQPGDPRSADSPGR